jgi:hypothetical protein
MYTNRFWSAIGRLGRRTSAAAFMPRLWRPARPAVSPVTRSRMWWGTGDRLDRHPVVLGRSLIMFHTHQPPRLHRVHTEMDT